MINPGVYNLGNFTITSAGTQISDEIEDLEGMLAFSVQGRLTYGSGGTTARLYVQTSLDQGTTWIDIACMLYGVVSENIVLNFSGLTPKLTQLTPTDGTLADDTAVDGVLGDRLRAKVISTGTYAGSTILSVRICVR